MVDYTRLAATAKRLIEANGRQVTLYKRGRTPANAAQPWRGPSTTPGDSVTPIVCIVPASGSGMGKFSRDEQGTLIRAVDKVALLASTSVPGETIDQYDSLVDTGGAVFKIVSTDELNPGSTSLIYVLGLKA